MRNYYENESGGRATPYTAIAGLHHLLSRRAALLAVTLAFVIGSFAGDTVPAVLAQGIPGGSYQQSCKNHDLAFGHLLYSACRNKAGNYVGSRLRFSFLCGGDISNQDGKLVCAKSSQSPQFKAAVSAFASASAAVLGRAPKSVGIEESEESASELLSWLALMHSINMHQQYKDGTKFSDAVAVLKHLLATQPVVRQAVVKQAYLEVYGTVPEPTKFEYWCQQLAAKTDWYLTLLSKLNAELNSNKGPFDRRIIIRSVYAQVFGRDADKGDLDYWMPRTENHSQMLAANRNWLYSDNGKGDLRATVKRAFAFKMKNPNPSDKEIEDTAKLFTPKRLIYIEMVK